MRLLLTLVLAILFVTTQIANAEVPNLSDRQSFDVAYTAWIKPEKKAAVVKIRIKDNPHWVRWLELSIDPKRHKDFLASGELVVDGEKVRWKPPADDAWLQYDVKLTSKRSNDRYDGYITDDWALFRADDLVPPIRSLLEDLVMTRAKLKINTPDGWSVTTRYPRYTSGRYKIDDPERLFDRPTGWMVMGKIATRRERIGDTSVAISGPVGQDVRSMDILAFFQWTLPVMQDIFPNFPERVLVVSAGNPMWRGALSGPGSLYVHADRPIVSGNGTSTFIHEMVHVAMSARSGPKADWIVEGLAEYYSLEVLRRSGTLSQQRFEKALKSLETWGAEAAEIEVDHSTGAITAKAVGVLREIDLKIREKSAGAHSLDDVVKGLAEQDAVVTLEKFYELVDLFSQPG